MSTEIKEQELVIKASEYAFKCHADVNHLYDGKPYSFHLQMAVDFAVVFIDLIPEKDRHHVIAGIYCHDVIEDTRNTFNDVKKVFNERVANICYALTNEKGKNRAERANDKYYKGIRQTQYAVFAKLCDRLANVKHSYDKYKLDPLLSGRMFYKYRAENEKFIYELFKGDGFKHSLLRLVLPKQTYITRQIINSPYCSMANYLHMLLNQN